MAHFIVETLQTFREVHVIEADSREDAEKIAENSDYNMSVFLGSQILTVKPYSDVAIEEYRAEDKYFWEGVKSVNADGYLVYTTSLGPQVTDEKIF